MPKARRRKESEVVGVDACFAAEVEEHEGEEREARGQEETGLGKENKQQQAPSVADEVDNGVDDAAVTRKKKKKGSVEIPEAEALLVAAEDDVAETEVAGRKNKKRKRQSTDEADVEQVEDHQNIGSKKNKMRKQLAKYSEVGEDGVAEEVVEAPVEQDSFGSKKKGKMRKQLAKDCEAGEDDIAEQMAEAPVQQENVSNQKKGKKRKERAKDCEAMEDGVAEEVVETPAEQQNASSKKKGKARKEVAADCEVGEVGNVEEVTEVAVERRKKPKKRKTDETLEDDRGEVVVGKAEEQGNTKRKTRREDDGIPREEVVVEPDEGLKKNGKRREATRSEDVGIVEAATIGEPDAAKCFKVCAARLPQDMDKPAIWRHFQKCGTIHDVHLIFDWYTWASRGVSFITFEDSAGVQAALELDGSEISGHKIRVNLAVDKDASTGKGAASEGKGKGKGTRRDFENEFFGGDAEGGSYDDPMFLRSRSHGLRSIDAETEGLDTWGKGGSRSMGRGKGMGRGRGADAREERRHMRRGATESAIQPVDDENLEDILADWPVMYSNRRHEADEADEADDVEDALLATQDERDGWREQAKDMRAEMKGQNFAPCIPVGSSVPKARYMWQLPQAHGPEVVLVGRSNAGKSTLLNTVFRWKKVRALVPASSKGGKTRTLAWYPFGFDELVGWTKEGARLEQETVGHHGQGLCLVDCFGLGQVEYSIKARRLQAWAPLLAEYISTRKSLTTVFHLVSCEYGGSLDPGDAQILEVIERAERNRSSSGLLDVNYVVVMTKIDMHPPQKLEEIKHVLLQEFEQSGRRPSEIIMATAMTEDFSGISDFVRAVEASAAKGWDSRSAWEQECSTKMWVPGGMSRAAQKEVRSMHARSRIDSNGRPARGGRGAETLPLPPML
mmetsp:Transcript_46999/g.118420  ORF Transcript_46999/g.118420 Transcript_46999/m.118420 type:complete len:901 (+) Transcript_46999:82-2784(+)